jgi:hypothetical protein
MSKLSRKIHIKTCEHNAAIAVTVAVTGDGSAASTGTSVALSAAGFVVGVVAIVGYSIDVGCLL